MHQQIQYINTFVGREQDIAEISSLLTEENCRLLTLVGLGGVGKTRLAIEAMPHLQDHFLDGVYFVELTGLESVEAILPTIASATDFSCDIDAKTPVVITSLIYEYFQEKQLLLILDNFEHLLEGVHHISTLIKMAPDVQFIVTSREVLNLQSEWVRNVDGLPYPTNNQPQADKDSPAVQLFVNRAQQFRQDFSLDAEYENVSRICQLVEGMPLAIELVAGWLKSLSCQAIVEQIQGNIDLLASRARDIPEKHRSIRAIFDNTVHRLSQVEQDLLARLSIFRGGFTQQAAEQVAGGTLPLLATLVDQSLIRVDSSGRYSIQELLRQYAHEQLQVIPNTGELQTAHCRYYLNLIIENEAEIVSGEAEHFAPDIENIQITWDWAVTHGYYEEIRKGAWGFHILHLRQGRDDDLSAIYQTMLKRLKQDEPQGDQGILYGYLLAFWGHIKSESDEVRQRATLQGIDILQRLGTPQEKAIAALQYLDQVYMFVYELNQVNEKFLEILVIFRDLNKPVLVLITLLKLGQMIVAYKRLSQFEEAKEYFREALILCDDLGARRYKADVLFELGRLYFFQEEFDFARDYMRQSLTKRIEANNRVGMASDLAWLGHTYMAQEMYDKARQYYQEMLVVAQDINHRPSISYALHDLGWLAYFEKDYSQANSLFIRSMELSEPYIHKLSLVVGIASVRAFTATETTVIEHISMVYNYPATIPRIKELGESGRAHLESFFSPDEYRAAWERGKTLDMEATFQKLLASASEQDSDKQSSVVIPAMSQTANQQLSDPLTVRELEILHLVAQGYSNKEICEHLVISKNTVRTHLKHLYSKLDADSRTRAVATARDLGLV